MAEYKKIVKTPMDLTTLKNNLESGSVDSAEEL